MPPAEALPSSSVPLVDEVQAAAPVLAAVCGLRETASAPPACGATQPASPKLRRGVLMPW